MAEKADVSRPNVRKKAEKVEEIKSKLKTHKSMVLLELSNLPDVLLQSSRKKLRDMDTEVIVAKKAILQRVFEADPKLAKFLEKIDKPVALVLSSKSPYELNKFFKKNRKKMAAKAGQLSPSEIVVPEGETDLPPGPALSELKNAGLTVQIKAGKIAVSKASTILRPGEEISLQKAKALQMLGIRPFEKWVNVLYGYDGQYVYASDVLNLDAFNAGLPAPDINTLLGNAFIQGVDVSINGILYSSQSIEQLLALGVRQGMALSGLSPKGAPEKPEDAIEQSSMPPLSKAQVGKTEAKAEEKKE